jgi:hypothetical protein
MLWIVVANRHRNQTIKENENEMKVPVPIPQNECGAVNAEAEKWEQNA